MFDVQNKTTVWQLKAKLMEYTQIPPILSCLFTKAEGGTALGETELVLDYAGNGECLYYGIKQDKRKVLGE